MATTFLVSTWTFLCIGTAGGETSATSLPAVLVNSLSARHDVTSLKLNNVPHWSRVGRLRRNVMPNLKVLRPRKWARAGALPVGTDQNCTWALLDANRHHRKSGH